MAVNAKVELITPSLAKSYVDDLAHNRGLVEAHVHGLAAQMKAGAWDENGQGIIFDTKGRLIDGQHRMTAVIEAGIPIKMLVVRGVESSAFDTIDTGRGRGGRDVLSIEGYDLSNQYAPMLTYVYRWTRGLFPSYNWRTGYATNSDLLALAKKYPETHDSLRWAYNRPRDEKMLTGKPSIAFAHWLTTRTRPTIAKRFWSEYVNGDGPKDAASMLFRKRVLVSITTSDRKSKLSPVHTVAIAATAWNYYATGRDVERLIWAKDKGSWPEFLGGECLITPTKAKTSGTRFRGAEMKEEVA